MKYLMLLSILLLPVLSQSDDIIEIERLPESLEQWYKPENKRNVWQHNMFKLRRELQAIENYAEQDDWDRVKKWSDNFTKHYQKISKMVPEWKYEIDLDAGKQLRAAVVKRNHKELGEAVKSLKENCKSCHESYRIVTAIQYRAPDFTDHDIVDKEGVTHSYQKYMQQLMSHLNTIIIANEDQRYKAALDAISALRTGIKQLGESCSSCHEKTPEAREYYLGEKAMSLLDTLQHSLENNEGDDTGKHIGAFAVYSCARCHGVHRISADMRNKLTHEPDE